MNEEWIAGNVRRFTVRSSYFDASALVKLVLDEDHSAAVRDYARENTNHLYTNSICFAEAFVVLKRKWQGKEQLLTVDTYYDAVRRITGEVRNRFRFEDMELLDPSVRDEVERLGKEHGLD